MLKKLYLRFCEKSPTLAEIFRFLLVGGTATVVDYLVAALVLLGCDALLQTGLYPRWYNVFFGGGEAAALVSVLSTALGFAVGLLVNYFLSVSFVFIRKGESKTKRGFAVFTALSVIGLIISSLGMFIFNGIFGANYWVVKIILTVVVLVYNYVSKKLLLFNR